MPRREKPEAKTPPARLDSVAGLAGSLAHDFSNLLMTIRNAGSLIQEDLPPNHACQQYVSELLQASERAMLLTRQLQAMGRSQLLKPDLVRPSEIVRSVRDMLRDIVPTDVEFRVAAPISASAVRFDATQLPVVMMNLVSYVADKIERHGRIQLVVRDEILTKRHSAPGGPPPGSYVLIAVARSGPAMDEAERKRAFNPRLAGRAMPQGTDLRLASAHGVVTQSGGYMQLARTGDGTEFNVFLPIVLDANPDSVTVPRRVQMHKDVSGDEVILVVEDDLHVRSTVRSSLEYYGYTVVEAADGEEALRLSALFNTRPDLLLTDLVMPNVTGRELIEALAMEGRLPKVLLMSGYTDDAVLQRASPAKLYPFIKKPFTHEELAAKVRELLDEP